MREREANKIHWFECPKEVPHIEDLGVDEGQ